jgi:hypothetical protein
VATSTTYPTNGYAFSRRACASQATAFCVSEHANSIITAAVSILAFIVLFFVTCVNIADGKLEYFDSKIVKYKDFFDDEQLLICGVAKSLEWGIPGSYFAATNSELHGAYTARTATRGRKNESVLTERAVTRGNGRVRYA